MRVLPGRAYHLVDRANYASVRRHGLLPASALLERAGPQVRADLNRTHRPTTLALPDGTILRDQRPMPPDALARCLTDATPADWYARLNSHVFFWLDETRAKAMQAAYRTRPQWRLTIDTSRLLARHAHAAFLTPINTGYAWRKPAPRSASTFVPYADWQQNGWTHEGRARPAAHRPVELVFACSIPDLEALEAEPPILITATSSNP